MNITAERCLPDIYNDVEEYPLSGKKCVKEALSLETYVIKLDDNSFYMMAIPEGSETA
jgi:hypothetical protein